MKFATLSALSFFVLSFYSVLGEAPKCDANFVCESPACRCSSTVSPLEDDEAPQLIALTFDEAILEDLYTNLWQPLFFDRVNPDGNPVSATFFVPHEYTAYNRVQDLYVHGFEIGVSSVTRNSLASYWSNATQEVLEQEFGDQLTIISTFANIPVEDIVGVRTPELQLEGDVSINAYIATGLQYDSSWTSRSTSMYFPYTLDTLSSQECRIGTSCPTDAHPGFWIAPIIDLQGNSSGDDPLECTALNACNVQGTADYIANWLLEQIERERSTTKAPLQLLVPSGWFQTTQNSVAAFTQFLDTLGTYDDVFLVSVKQIIEWTQNPVSLDEFQTAVFDREGDCLNVNCPLYIDANNIRYMRSCIPCPQVYPWLGNPLGEP